MCITSKQPSPFPCIDARLNQDQGLAHIYSAQLNTKSVNPTSPSESNVLFAARTHSGSERPLQWQGFSVNKPPCWMEQSDRLPCHPGQFIGNFRWAIFLNGGSAANHESIWMEWVMSMGEGTATLPWCNSICSELITNRILFSRTWTITHLLCYPLVKPWFYHVLLKAG